MNTPQISVVIPTFNRRDHLQQAIHSVSQQNSVDFECLIIDNGPSTDGTAEMFASAAGGDVRFKLVTTGPIGIFPAVNRGFAESVAPVVLVMDDDVELVDPGTLSYLVEQFNTHTGSGVIGLSEFYPQGRHEGHQNAVKSAGFVESLKDTRLYSPGRINKWGMIGTKFHQLPFGETIRLDHVRSSAMAVRREVFDLVGGFFEPYTPISAGYRCETDFCLQVQRTGWDVMFSAQDPQVLHKQAPRVTGYGRDGLDREYLVGTGSGNTFFFLRNYWGRRSAPLFMALDLLVGNTSQPGVLRLVKQGAWKPSTYWHAINGKWQGLRLFLQYGPVAAR